MGFPKQEHWNGLPFPLPGDLPDPGIEFMSPALAGRFFATEPPGKPFFIAFEKFRAITSSNLTSVPFLSFHPFLVRMSNDYPLYLLPFLL